MTGESEVVQRGRLERACAIVAIGIVVLAVGVPLGMQVPSEGAARAPAEGAVAGVDAQSAIEARGPEEALDALEEMLGRSQGELPAAYREELGVVPGSYDVRTAHDGSVVGFLVDGGVGEVGPLVREAMEQRGWTAVELGGVKGETYVKREGVYTWAMVTYVAEGRATSVVIRTAS